MALTKCDINFLGRSGLRVSNICLGAMTFGESNFGTPGQLDEQGAHALMDRYVQWGGNFIDTADIYGRGKSETIVGSWLAKQKREDVVIATKVRFPIDVTRPNSGGLSRRHITASIEGSLRRLQTDYVDLYQIHAWDDAVPLEETLSALSDLVRCGKVRYLGASNVTGWQLQKIVDMSREMGLSPFISLQQQYNLLSRLSELEPFQVCKTNGIGVLPWSPLKAGFLAGKVKKGDMPKDGRLEYAAYDPQNKFPGSHPSWEKLDKEQHWRILETVEKIAQTRGKTMAQVSLRWLVQKSVVSSVIIGATKMTQLDDNMAASSGWQLSEEEMSQLDEVSKPELGYPYDVIWRANKDRVNPWNPAVYV
ncbi:hypothetical protein C0Q70_17382 [Pomacea canaliculata]|uniref:NADP-dependent oxidoreductase domain-containing protein n=1 Tax=Pomacea canaliculata TaxID=400727 RepID=A0A2T7NK90_POMCA|nr:uncharacterized protein LOC112575939 [Pomacea canaliculata]XP_025113872.1 uncharacterized protein LOC112575939 [Pomacea canaliculata]PVD21584.1 hypothetical protein C0Q70_17382 [Pomacea canaliculata]